MVLLQDCNTRSAAAHQRDFALRSVHGCLGTYGGLEKGNRLVL
jgi:hypothetical protein